MWTCVKLVQVSSIRSFQHAASRSMKMRRVPLLIQTFSLTSRHSTKIFLQRESSDRFPAFWTNNLQFSTALFPKKDPAQLLAEADVHCLPIGVVSKEYVLVEGGTDLLTLQKHPEIQWARIWVTSHQLHGPAVNRLELGDVWPVCDKLVDKALEDIDGTGKGQVPLHGLAPWVLAGIEALAADTEHPIVPFLRELPEVDLNNLAAVAEGEYHDDSFYDEAKHYWEELALLFLEICPPPASVLFLKKGATLLSIQHRTDPTEEGHLSGGAVALYRFPEKLAQWEIEDMEIMKQRKAEGYKEDEYDGEEYFNDDEDFTLKKNTENFDDDDDDVKLEDDDEPLDVEMDEETAHALHDHMEQFPVSLEDEYGDSGGGSKMW